MRIADHKLLFFLHIFLKSSFLISALLCEWLQKKAVCCHVDIHHNTSGVYELDKKAGPS